MVLVNMKRRAAGATLSRCQTAPPLTFPDMTHPTPSTSTMLSTLASTTYIEEVCTEPSSPASATTAHMGTHMGAAQQKKKGNCDAREAHSTQSAPCFGGLGKRRASESNIGRHLETKRSRPHLAHVESAIKQVGLAAQGLWQSCAGGL